MKLNAKGYAAIEKVQEKYDNERAYLDKHPEDLYHNEFGWCIVEDLAETPEELAEVYVYGDTEWAFYNLLEEPCNRCDIDQTMMWNGENKKVSVREFIHMLMQYFDFDDEDWEWFMEHGITKEEVE